MDHKVQLKHPKGKKPVSMSKEKYEILKPLVVKCLRTKGEVTFNEISNAVEKDFKANRTKFQGSLRWYLEWVKLDLEARKIIKRIAGTSPQKYVMFK